MTIRDKYPKLQDPEFVKNMVVKSAHGNMCLEGQEIDIEKVKELYDKIIKSSALRDGLL